MVTRLYEQKLRPHGLRATQFSILAALALKGSCQLGELAEVLGLERTSLTRAAARLERDALISVTAGNDARARVLTLTDGGRQRLEAALPAWQVAQGEASREHC